MTENHTSMAVDEWLRSFGRTGECDLKAICQRSQRMEKALERLVFLHQCEQEALKPPTFEQWIAAVDAGGDALSFDPLSPSSR